MRRIQLLISACLLFAFCTREAPPSPCETVDCGNHGRCLHGGCVCDDGFSGETCETVDAPSEMLIERILVREYPIYRENTGWDSSLIAPYFLPDLQVQLVFPWGDAHDSWCYSNAPGSPLTWTIETFPSLHHHIHFGDSLELVVMELDGVDSLEVVAPPEMLTHFEISTAEIVLVDSADWWPAQTLLSSDTSSIEVIINWKYGWD